MLDALAVVVGMLFGSLVRFQHEVEAGMIWYLPTILLAAIGLPCVLYIGGLYTEAAARADKWVRLRWLIFGLLACLLIIFTAGALYYDMRIGRGVLAFGFPVIVVLCFFHHWVELGRAKSAGESAVCLVSSEDDERAAEILSRHSRRTRIAGLICVGKYVPRGSIPVLGALESIERVDLKSNSVILVRDGHMVLPEVASFLRRWRYEGIEILSLTDLCEEVFRAVPLQMVTESWLFRASTQSNLFYIKKLKRLFDIVASLTFMVILSPFLLIGMYLVKRQSPGGVFFKQERLGRLGRPFEVVKLRTMHLDAEKDGPKWSVANDTRVFPAGKWLRKFRVDEIPQLLNVLRGEMSFVGPRPEREVFVKDLEKKIPHYRERLYIQPGLTGWAQVRYPYGSCAGDAWRKLEFDLYYMKHMSLLLDFFVLLETVRTVVIGGVKSMGESAAQANQEWNLLSPGLLSEVEVGGSSDMKGRKALNA
jgi:exopolysaccharide biosynthesis polyprenyl glycosylphosphotransferase